MTRAITIALEHQLGKMPTRIDEPSVEALVSSYKAIPDIDQACLVWDSS